MANGTLFGLSLDTVKQRCLFSSISCDRNSPINSNEYLEPCIRGAEKIIKDKDTKDLINSILRK